MEKPKKKPPVIVSPEVTQLPSDIRKSMLCQISWTHHLVILSGTKTEAERDFYINLCIKERYGKRELERQICSCLFERIVIGKQSFPPSKNSLHQTIVNTFKDNYVFEFLNLPEQHSEDDLQKALIAQLKIFILELGKDFYSSEKNTGYKSAAAIFILTFYFITEPCVVWLRLNYYIIHNITSVAL